MPLASVADEVDFHMSEPHSEAVSRLKGTKVFLGARLTDRRLALAGQGLADLDDKGSEIVLRAWKQHPTLDNLGTLILVEKGQAASQLRKAVEDDSTFSGTMWLPELDYFQFLRVTSASDIVIDSLGRSVLSRVAVDALVAGKQVLTSSPPAIQRLRLGSAFDCLNFVATPEALREEMRRFGEDPSELTPDSQQLEFARQLFHPSNAYSEVISQLTGI